MLLTNELINASSYHKIYTCDKFVLKNYTVITIVYLILGFYHRLILQLNMIRLISHVTIHKKTSRHGSQLHTNLVSLICASSKLALLIQNTRLLKSMQKR